MRRRPPRATRTATLFPYTPRCLSVGLRPDLVQPVGGLDRADDVETTLHDGGRNVADLLHLCQQLSFFQEDAVAEIVCLDARQAEGVTLLAEGGDRLRRRQQGGAASLVDAPGARCGQVRSEEHTSELQSLMRISYAVFCLKKKTERNNTTEKKYTSLKINMT